MKKTYDTNAPLVDHFLESVKDRQEVDPAPYLYSRLMARMESRQGAWQLPLRPAWIIGALSLLLFINGWMLLSKTDSPPSKANTENPVQSLASAYDLNVQSIY